MHVFIECPFARSCWALVGLLDWLEDHVMQVEGSNDLIFRILVQTSRSKVEMFAILLWYVWKCRNAMVQTGTCGTTVELVFAAAVFQTE